MEKFLGFLYKETNNLNQAALLLGVFSFLSLILAFLRDRLLAHIFGASLELDIYYAAFRIPDLIFVLAASVVSLSVLVPFIIERDAKGDDVLKNFIQSMFAFFSLLIALVSILAFVLMPYLSPVLFKGFSLDALEKVVLISRILLLSPIILGFSNLLSSLTQAYNRFTTYALAPPLYNAGIIIGIIFLSGSLGIVGVAMGVILGALFHAMIQLPFVIKKGLLPKPSLTFNHNIVRDVVSISLPRTFTLSMTHFVLIALVAMASLMSTGSISILNFSFNLQSVPLSIIGVSYSLAAFPTLSRHFRENNLNRFITQMSTTAKMIIFWSLPITTLFVVLRAQIVRVVLGSGQFSWDDTRLTAAALALFIASSTFQSLLLLFMRGFYSAGFTKRPFFINLVATIVTIGSAWWFIGIFYESEAFRYFVNALFRVEDLRDTAVLMLPLGFSLGIFVNGLLHWYFFERMFRGFSKELIKVLFQSFSAAVILGVAGYVGLNIFANVFNTATLVGIFLQGLCAGVLAILAGVAVLKALGSKELEQVWGALCQRFWKSRVIATDPEIV